MKVEDDGKAKIEASRMVLYTRVDDVDHLKDGRRFLLLRKELRYLITDDEFSGTFQTDTLRTEEMLIESHVWEAAKNRLDLSQIPLGLRDERYNAGLIVKEILEGDKSGR